MNAYLFVFERTNWAIEVRYCYSLENARKIEKKLQELLDNAKVLWFKRITIWGYNVQFPDVMPFVMEELDR